MRRQRATAERQANDELPSPALRSGEHQVGEICARHQEHQRRDRRQNHQRPGVAGALRCIAGRRPSALRRLSLALARHLRDALAKRAGFLGDETLVNEACGGRGLLDAHAGSQIGRSPSATGLPCPSDRPTVCGASGISAGCIVSGIQTSDGWPTECPVNPAARHRPPRS